MRKKTYIKDQMVTRTVAFSTVKCMGINLVEKTVEEWEYKLVGEYNETEARLALEEMGFAVAVVSSVEVNERKVSMKLSDFVKNGVVEG